MKQTFNCFLNQSINTGALSLEDSSFYQIARSIKLQVCTKYYIFTAKFIHIYLSERQSPITLAGCFLINY
jgi:hypothetical protein